MSEATSLSKTYLRHIVCAALREDIGKGDVTTNAMSCTKNATGELLAKEHGVFCGIKIIQEICTAVQPHMILRKNIEDGKPFKKADLLCTLHGQARTLLSIERVLLNFLQRMSGIATLTRTFVNCVQHAKIYDTRKTTPLLRQLEKYAVRCGGGCNHRFGLFDAILIKDNHIVIANSVTNALRLTQKKFPRKPREIEVKNNEELQEALHERAEIIMLDNSTPLKVRRALQIIAQAPYKPEIEVSGGITLANVRDFDLPGVHRISIGALTHSAPALDLKFRITPNT